MLGVGVGVNADSTVAALLAAGLTVDDIHPPTHELTEATADSTILNASYDATETHFYVIDFKIPDPETAPASNETIFYHGVGFNNYVWLRYRDTGSVQLVVRSLSDTLLDFNFKSEMLYVNKKMRVGLFINNVTGLMEVYINGRRWSTSTGKREPNSSASTRTEFNAAFSSDVASSDGIRLRYYDVEKTRDEMELITNVTLKELGLSYSYDETALGLIGQGQSNMSGGEVIGNKSIMPEVANGRLNMINTNGDYEAFSESWYNPGAKTPIFKAFAQTFVGNGFTHLAGYMGRVGNDIAASQTRNVVVSCAAASATDIAADWAGARTDLNGAPDNIGTTEAIGYMTFAIHETIRQMKAKCREVVVVHDQGQSDAVNAMSQIAYETEFNAQLDWIDYYHPDVFHLIVGFNEYNAASTAVEANWDNINAARRAVAESRVNCAFVDVSNVAVTNPDGLHYLDAEQEVVGAYIAKTYLGGNKIEFTNPTFGETVLTGSEPWNNKQEGFIIVSYNTSQNPSNQYMVHLNDGGSSPATGVRTIGGANTIGQLYRDDVGNVLSNGLNGFYTDNRTQTYAYTWCNRLGRAIQIGNEGTVELNSFTPDAGVFATDTWSRLRLGERNGGSEPYGDDLFYVQIGDTYLDEELLKKKMNEAPRINLMSGGQSIARQFFNSTGGSNDDGVQEILNQMRIAFPEQEVLAFDGAEGGSTVSELSYTEFWWEPLGEQNRGPELQDFHDVRLVNGANKPIVWWDLGVTDAHYIDLPSEVTFDVFKRDMLKILNEIRRQEPEVQFGILLTARRTTFGNTPSMQRIRDFYIELIEEYSWIHRLPDIYDIDLFDAVHHTDAGIVTHATRMGRKMANIAGASLTGVDGPSITNVTRSGLTVTVTATHDAGTDFQTVVGNIQGFVFHDDANPITISAAVKTSPTTFELTLDSLPSGQEILYYGHDAMLDITDLTKVLRDNATPAMALQLKKFIL